MSYKTFKAAFDTYMSTNWTHTPIHDFVNSPGDKVSGFDAWVSYENDSIFEEVSSMSGGNVCMDCYYDMTIDIYTASASGDDEAIDLVDKMKSLFINKSLGNNTWFRDIEVEFGKNNESSGKWFRTRISLMVEHRYQQ